MLYLDLCKSITCAIVRNHHKLRWQSLTLRKAKRKSASGSLERRFLFLLCIAPPQAGRDVGARRRNPGE